MIAKPEAVKQVTAPKVEKKESLLASDSPKATDGSLSQLELAERLGIDTSNVGRARKREGEHGFPLWSKERDPDKIGWQYREKVKRYFPQDAP